MIDRTKATILDSFNNLIKKKSFDSITIEMIVKEAGISRTTFYRYFKDKYDVMNYNFQQVLEEYFNKENVDTFEDLFYIFFKIGKEKWSTMTNMFDSSGANSLNKFITETCYSAAILTLGNRIGFDNITPQDRLQISVFCHGVPETFLEWVNGEYDMSPKDAAEAAIPIIPPKLRGEIFKKE